jgi:hypothetical protein
MCSKKGERMPTVKDIIELWLKDNGYDGLVNREGYEYCGCGLNDLIPCGGDSIERCEAAYKEKCKRGPMFDCFVLEKGKEKNCGDCDV